MSPERRPAREQEISLYIPKGEELLQRSFGLARKALLDTYPVLGWKENEGRLLFPNHITTVDLDSLKEMERTMRPKNDVLLYSALQISGVAPERIDEMTYNVNEECPVLYVPQEDSTIYISTDMMKILESDDDYVRLRDAIYLGSWFILSCLENLPTPNVLPSQSEWKEIVREGLNRKIQELKVSSEGVNRRNILKTERMISQLMDVESTIIAKGARVQLLLPGQSPTNPEFTIGREFDRGTALSLAHEPKTRFLKAVQGAFLMPGHLSVAPLGEQRRSEEIIRNIGELSKVNKSVVLAAYIDSLIPMFYHSGSGKRINPWVYPD